MIEIAELEIQRYFTGFFEVKNDGNVIKETTY